MLPEDFGLLRNLIQLYLTDNLLEELPESICNLRRLMVFQVSVNRLCDLPAQLGQLDRLFHLSVAYNQLLYSRSFLQLVRLKVSFQLRNLPATFAKLNKLVTLELQHNRISQLPPRLLFSLTRLVKLTMQGNCLQSIGADIGSLSSLVELDVRNNLLTLIPVELGRLEKLKGLLRFSIDIVKLAFHSAEDIGKQAHVPSRLVKKAHKIGDAGR